MKRSVLTLVITLSSLFSFGQKTTDPAWKTLFNGRDFTGWETYLDSPYSADEASKAAPLGLNNDPNQVFSVVTVDGQPALRISGETYGGINTRASFGNYHLRLAFKWGQKQWPPKLNQPRDSGLLYHSTGAHSTPMLWMESFEYQVQEGDCGDYWGVMDVLADVPARKNEKGKFVYQPGSAPVSFQDKTPNGRSCLKSPNAEKPTGQWNIVDLYCLGDTAVHVMNGTVNMVLLHTRHLVDGQVKPLTAGKIQLQSEGAEVFYRDIQVRPITALPAEIVTQIK